MEPRKQCTMPRRKCLATCILHCSRCCLHTNRETKLSHNKQGVLGGGVSHLGVLNNFDAGEADSGLLGVQREPDHNGLAIVPFVPAGPPRVSASVAPPAPMLDLQRPSASALSRKCAVEMKCTNAINVTRNKSNDATNVADNRRCTPKSS